MKNTSKGTVLVISLWMLMIFSIFAIGLYKLISSQVRIVQRLEHFILSEHAARSICLYTRFYLDSDESDYDTIYELNTEKTGEFGILNYSYILQDQESKINVNTMSSDVLKRLPGLNEDIVDAITESPLSPFYVKEELLLLDEINEELFAEFSEYITTYGNGKININTASREILIALIETEASGVVDIIMAFRAGLDGEEGTEDERIFESKSGILTTLQEFETLFLEQQTQLISAMSLLDVKGEVFSLQINTEVLGKKAMEYDIIMDNEKIFQWKER